MSGLDLVVAFCAGVCVGLLVGLLVQPSTTSTTPAPEREASP